MMLTRDGRSNCGLIIGWPLYVFSVEQSAEPLRPAAAGSCFESHVSWDGKFHLGSNSWPAENLQASPDSLRTLAHASEAPVALAARLQHVSIDSTAVVSYKHTQTASGVFDFNLNFLG
jgi:hypothetical protein